MRGKSPVIMIVDDEPETRKYVGMNLRARGFEVVPASDGDEALQIFNERPVDLLLLDITMPGQDGFQVCEQIRRENNVPIIMLSARGKEHDKVSALMLGADDYLTKPFGVRELLARVRSALRRAYGEARSTGKRYDIGDLEVDLTARRVLLRGERIRLTPAEFSLLSLLVRNAGQVVTSRAILEAIWGDDSLSESEYVVMHIRRLRQKIEDDPESPALIVTEPGVGYRFASAVAAGA